MNIWSSDTSSVRINHAIAPPKLDHLSEKCLRFLPHFHQSHICYIIEPKIAPFPISRNCPTLRLASLDTAMAYPVFLQELIWGHSHGQAFIEWITYFSFFPHEHMRPLHKTSHFFVYSKNHPLIKTTVCPRGGGALTKSTTIRLSHHIRLVPILQPLPDDFTIPFHLQKSPQITT